MQQPSFSVRAVCVGKGGAYCSVQSERYRYETLAYVLLGRDVYVRTGVVGETGRRVYFCDCDVLEHRAGEYIQGYQFVVRVRRRHRQTVKGGQAVPVAQSADEELAGVVEGYAAHGLHGLGHVGQTFCPYLGCPDVLNGLCGHLAVIDQRHL